MSELPEKREPATRQAEAALRVSTREREAVAARLQAAFAQGMLDEGEFDGRMNAALAAKTRGELYPLTSDLPELLAGAPVAGGAAAAAAPTADGDRTGKPAGRFITGYGSRIERKGRWTVPARVSPVIFKGSTVIDLRAATLTAEETRFGVTAYKSTIEIIVPPGVGVDTRGLAYKGAWVDETGDEAQLAAGVRRTVRVRGIAYKSKVIVRRMPRA